MMFLINLGKCQDWNQEFDWGSHPDLDSLHVTVGRNDNTLDFYPKEITPNSDVYFDEYVIKDKYHTLPQYVLTFQIVETTKKILIWRDTNISNSENSSIFCSIRKKFSQHLTAHGVNDNEVALQIIDTILDKSSIYVITNRSNGGREFLEEVRKKGVSNSSVVYCRKTDGWIPIPNVEIFTSSTALFDFISKKVLA
jgi:hypothetical protein